MTSQTDVCSFIHCSFFHKVFNSAFGKKKLFLVNISRLSTFVQKVLTINILLILKVRDNVIFFAGKTYNGAFRYAQDNLGVKKFSAPSKNSQKCPIICFAPDKKIIYRTLKIRGALVFLCPKERERERERESKRESKSESKSERESESKSKSKRER
jgi:hypothetical protein